MPKVMTIGSLDDCGCGVSGAGLGGTRRRTRRRKGRKSTGLGKYVKGKYAGVRKCGKGKRAVLKAVKVCYRGKGGKKICRTQKKRVCGRPKRRR